MLQNKKNFNRKLLIIKKRFDPALSIDADPVLSSFEIDMSPQFTYTGCSTNSRKRKTLNGGALLHLFPAPYDRMIRHTLKVKRLNDHMNVGARCDKPNAQM